MCDFFKGKSTYFRTSKINPLEEWNNGEVMNLVKVFLKIKEDISRVNKKPNELFVTLKLSKSFIDTLKV